MSSFSTSCKTKERPLHKRTLTFYGESFPFSKTTILITYMLSPSESPMFSTKLLGKHSRTTPSIKTLHRTTSPRQRTSLYSKLGIDMYNQRQLLNMRLRLFLISHPAKHHFRTRQMLRNRLFSRINLVQYLSMSQWLSNSKILDWMTI